MIPQTQRWPQWQSNNSFRARSPLSRGFRKRDSTWRDSRNDFVPQVKRNPAIFKGNSRQSVLNQPLFKKKGMFQGCSVQSVNARDEKKIKNYSDNHNSKTKKVNFAPSQNDQENMQQELINDVIGRNFN